MSSDQMLRRFNSIIYTSAKQKTICDGNSFELISLIAVKCHQLSYYLLIISCAQSKMIVWLFLFQFQWKAWFTASLQKLLSLSLYVYDKYNNTDIAYAFKSSSAIGFRMRDGVYDPNYVARTKESFHTTLTRTFSSHTRWVICISHAHSIRHQY